MPWPTGGDDSGQLSDPGARGSGTLGPRTSHRHLPRSRHTVAYDGAEEVAMTDPIADIIGDYRAFAAQQRDRLLARGIDIAPFELSHLAFRVPEWDQYVHVRTLLERHASANSENVWNGRPISLILPAEPLEVLDGKAVPMIELDPARPPAGLQDGPRAPRGRRRRHVRRVRRGPQARPHRTAVPGTEQHAGPRVHPVRGLHPREVLSMSLQASVERRGAASSTASTTWTTGCRSAS